MSKRMSFDNAACPVARAMAAIGDSWSILIIRDAMRGIHRFGAFQKNIGIAKNILATRLKALTANGILAAMPASDGTAYLEYVLTPKGRALFPVIVALRQWSEEHAFASDELQNYLADKATKRPVRKLELRDADGQLLGSDDTMLVHAPSHP